MPNAPFLAPERDSAFKIGRAKDAGAVIQYSVPGVALASSGTQAASVDQDFYAPWRTDTPIIIDQLSIEVTTLDSGKNVRIGFYAADLDWQPVGGPLADSGNISVTTTGVKTYTPGAPVYVPRGRYLSVINTDTSVAAYRVFRGAPVGGSVSTTGGQFTQFVSNSRTYGAFPTPGGTWETVAGSGSTPWFHFVVYRVSQP